MSDNTENDSETEVDKDHPKVFISYSWRIKEKVLDLADRLISNGVQAIIDEYDLSPGNDKYAFMEKQVSDNSIKNVLIICDKTYAEKADRREGGVGDETIIITPEIYGKTSQTKFIPVIFEKDESGKPFCPAYIKGKIYIDLADDDTYEAEYEKLLRQIYNAPLRPKPKLGEKPQWIDNKGADLSDVRVALKNTRGSTDSRISALAKTTIDSFVEAAKQYKVSSEGDVYYKDILKLIDQTRQFRDLFIDFCQSLVFNDNITDEIIVSFFETFYNKLSAPENTNSKYGYIDHEIIEFLTWELFIDLSALLLYFEKYEILYSILSRSYYLRYPPRSSEYAYQTFDFFNPYCSTIEERCKPVCDNPNLFSLSANIITGREYHPYLTTESISNADLVLYQMGEVLFPRQKDNSLWTRWFPRCYVYYNEKQIIGKKMESKSYCLKIAPLFGVKTLIEIKEQVKNSPFNYQIKYSGATRSAPAILSSISIDTIGAIP